ncbi:hypothetical protein NXS19_008069 [Fusarium pseudograminearum]|nr:hypothetical protein NXS19_008069 [Fusarium pseudograminearum]
MADQLNLVTSTAEQLQRLLGAGALNSRDLVVACLDQIERHNCKGLNLRAVVQAAPRDLAIEQAKALDVERATKGPRGPLHGIPVLVKDHFATQPSLGMGTTCGTAALRDARPIRNAVVIDKLIEAGLIVIGKASLSELCLLKATPPNTGGWCSASGQGQSPYVRGGVTPNAKYLGHSTPCGSSSGSAIGIAAGFAPVSIGTETDGSIVYPATRAGLYAIKPNIGAVPLEGAMPVNSNYDTHGGMAKSPSDLAHLLEVMTGRPGLGADLPNTWKGVKVGYLDFKEWRLTANEMEESEAFDDEVFPAFAQALDTIKANGAEVKGPLKLLTVEDIAEMPNGADFDSIANDGWRDSFDQWLKDWFEYSPVQDMRDLVKWHNDHADECLPADHPSQAYLEFHAFEAKPDPEFPKKHEFVRSHAKQAIDQLFQSHDLDVLIGNGDGRMTAIASAAGYAVGSAPLGYAETFNGRAFGINLINGIGGERKMFEVMKAWEKTFPDGRKAPPALDEKSF